MTAALLRNEMAEQAVLAACFADPVAIVTARSLIGADDFAGPKHRLLFAAMRDVVDAGAAVDPLTVATRLDERGDLATAGGKGYIGYLLDVVPDARNVAHYAAIVQTCASRRRLLDTLADAKTAIETGADTPLAEIAGAVQASLSSAVTQSGRRGFHVVTGEEVIALADDLAARRETRLAGGITGVATGYPELDDRLHGLRPGEFLIIGARPKAGKTALCLNITTNAIVDGGHAGGFVSTEMLREELLERIGNRLARITTDQSASGSVSDAEVARYAMRVSEVAGRLHIDDEAFPTLDDVIARSIDLKARHPEIAFLVVDYLQRVTKRMAGRRGDEEIAAVTEGMKKLAKQLRIPVIAPAQVNYKDSDKRENKAPTLADLQGGSGFAQDANFVLLLHRPAVFDPDPSLERVLQVELAASRRCQNFTTRLDWHGEFMAIDSPMRRAAQDRPRLVGTASLTFPDTRSA